MANNDYNTYDYIFKIIIIGAEGCGKTSIMHRFCKEEFL